MRSGRYVLAKEDSALEQKAAEKQRRLERGEARARAAEKGTKTRGGKRDYCLRADTKHYPLARTSMYFS